MRIFWRRLHQHFLLGAVCSTSVAITNGFLFSGSLHAAHVGLSSDQPTHQLVRFTSVHSPPPDRGTPDTPYGTGSRGNCPSNVNLPPMAPLVGSTGLELTVSERPSFWIYIPYTSSQVTTGRFSLQADDQEVYQAPVQLPTTPGIISITAPEAMFPLTVGQRYRWYFEIVCPQSEPAEQPAPATLTGIVQRVLPTEALTNDLAAAESPLERISAYANHHIWYDTLTELGQLRLSAPEQPEFRQQWTALLRSDQVGLAVWSEAPFVGEAMLSNLPESISE